MFYCNSDTEVAFESSLSPKLVLLPSMLPVTSTAIHPVQIYTQVGDRAEKH